MMELLIDSIDDVPVICRYCGNMALNGMEADQYKLKCTMPCAWCGQEGDVVAIDGRKVKSI